MASRRRGTRPAGSNARSSRSKAGDPSAQSVELDREEQGIEGGPPRPGVLFSAAARHPLTLKRSVVIPLLLVVALALAARLPRLAEPIGGFVGFNEANYLLEASNFSRGSLLVPTVDGTTPFIETPPLYAFLLFAVSLVFGPSLLVARGVTVAISLLLMALTALLARARFGKRAGWITAVLMSVAPVAAITGRNIQTDSLYLALVAGAMLAWPREDAWTWSRAIRVGTLLGLALFTKLFAGVAIVALVCYEIWRAIVRRRAGQRIDLRPTVMVPVIAGAIPLLFYGYHFVRDRSFFMQHVLGGAAAATTFPQSVEEVRLLLSEAWWAFTPLLALTIVAGILMAVMKRSRDDVFVLLPLTAYTIFYLHTHKHSYYLLSLLPFAAILAARALALLPWRALRFAVIVAIATHGAFLSLVNLTTMKLGYRDFADLGSWAGRLPADAQFVLERDVADNAFTIVMYYLPGRRLLLQDSLPQRSDGYLQLPPNSFLVRWVDENEASTGAEQFSRDRHALSLGLWSAVEEYRNPHYFRQKGLHFMKKERFGVGFTTLESYPALEALSLEGRRAFRRDDGRLWVD
ncbi:MAG TPA: glycosyltransferase family 39 protein [Thermoanaerobaculia bacterium]